MSKVYTQSQAINFIEKVFGPGKTSNQGKNIQVVCPVCRLFKGNTYNNQKLAIRTDNFLLHCWVCGYKDRNLLKLLRKYRIEFVSEYKENFLNSEDLSQVHKENILINSPICLPDGFKLLCTSNYRDNYFVYAKNYLENRGVSSIQNLWYWKFGITKETPERKEDNCKYRIIIPSYDCNGDLNYWTARSWLEEKVKKRQVFKYKNPNKSDRTQIIFNEINIDWSQELTLVEGPFDLLKCNKNATAILGSELDANWKLFQKILQHKTPILLAFDNEPRAQNKQFKIAAILNEFNIAVRILELPKKNIDVGDLTNKQFIALKNKAKIYSNEYNLRRKIAQIRLY